MATAAAEIRRALSTLVVGASLMAGAAGLSAALNGHAFSGVVYELQGGIVESASPSGFAWRDGIRSGQQVIALDGSEADGTWRLETWDGSSRRSTAAASADLALRAGLPLGVVGFAAGCLAILLKRAARSWAVGASCVAFLASSWPLWLQGDLAVSSASLAAAPVVSLSWLAIAIWTRIATVAGRAVGVGVLGAAGFVGWSALGRFMRLGSPGLSDLLVGTLAAVGTVAVLFAVTVPHGSFGRATAGQLVPRPRQVARTFALGGAALVLIQLGLAAIGLVAISALAFAPPLVSRLGADRIGTALVPGITSRISIEASEAERARIATQLHDVPLQQLTGVIQRLDLLPGAGEASEQLRALAHELRVVAADQRPPVLDDLGLAAALEFVAEQRSTNDVPVRTRIDDRTGLAVADRPPSNLELAILRIAQEAVANALRHAHPTQVLIDADIAADHIDVKIIDDGIGLTPETVSAAARRGRLGVASMRRRALAVGAELSITGSQAGTTVSATWSV